MEFFIECSGHYDMESWWAYLTNVIFHDLQSKQHMNTNTCGKWSESKTKLFKTTAKKKNLGNLESQCQKINGEVNQL